MKSSQLKLLCAIGITTSLIGCSGHESNAMKVDQADKNHSVSKATNIWSKLNITVKQDSEMESKVIDLINGMTLEPKITQMI